MADIVRDILINIDSGDLVFPAVDTDSQTFFQIVWGALFNDDEEDEVYANIPIPLSKIGTLKADDDGRLLLYVKSSYCPCASSFHIRLVLDDNGTYERISQNQCQFPIDTVAYYPNRSALTVMASELPGIDIDGNFLLRFDSGRAYVYSAGNTDFSIGSSDLQSSRLLSICEPGKYYRYPTTGVGSTNYIGSVIKNTDLGDNIIQQFSNDGKTVQDADFDARTGELQIIFFNEEVRENEGLLSVDDSFIQEIDFTDEDLAAISTYPTIDDFDEYYDELFNGVNAYQESCFGNGIWIGRFPWKGRHIWKTTDNDN